MNFDFVQYMRSPRKPRNPQKPLLASKRFSKVLEPWGSSKALGARAVRSPRAANPWPKGPNASCNRPHGPAFFAQRSFGSSSVLTAQTSDSVVRTVGSQSCGAVAGYCWLSLVDNGNPAHLAQHCCWTCRRDFRLKLAGNINHM